NEAPSAAELPPIRDFITQEQSTLDALNAHIEQLVSRRDATVDSIRRHVAVLSPTRRIHADVWCEIFSWVAFTRKVGDQEIPCPRWRLAHICRSWREITLSSPLLWSTVDIVQPAWNVSVLDTHPMPMIQCQLLRVSNAPLDVSLDIWHANEAEMALLDVLMSHSHRWGTFNVCIRHVSGVRDVLLRLENIRGRIPQLRTFDLSLKFSYYYGEEPCNFLSVAPALRKVSLMDHRPSCLPRFNLPWAQITHYRGAFKKDMQLDILSAARNLIECDLSFRDTYSPPSYDVGTMVTLPHLRRLRFDVREEADFLNHLSAPLLQEAHIRGQLDPILPFVQRSETLTKLVIQDAYSNNPDTIPGILQTSPNLETLIYMPLDPEDSEPVWLAMTVSDHKLDLCPHLEFLGWTWDGQVALEPLFGMIQSRTTSDDWLTVRLLVETQVQEHEIGERFRAVDTLGLDIDVSSVQDSRDLVGEW
ncbi:hypothetical protein FB45DRAFT_148053, partial [Roridomyces roridus]